MSSFNHRRAGISSLGFHFPSLVMSVETLAKLRNVDPDKFTIGLGCKDMALCPENYGIVDLAAEAAERALSRWNGDLKDIGLIAVGTESAIDMSRPLSAWVAEKLGIRGPVRSYEIKHACYGGTVAVRQAVEWKLAGVAPGKSALIIAADISLYEPGQPSEPTQGAGAAAMIIGEPKIAEIDPISYPWSIPAFDFWRPVGRAHPLVEGQFSLHCYQQAALECFGALLNNDDPEKILQQYKAFCFHTPFPKMVKKAFATILLSYGIDEKKIENMFSEKVDRTMDWNRLCGNAYTASVWIAIGNALCGLQPGERIAAFSYGSGCGAELLTLSAGPEASRGKWADDINKDVGGRKEIDEKIYNHMRSKEEYT